MSIEINNESGVAVDEVALVELGRFVLDSLSVNPMVELSIVLLDPDAMAALHLQWMDVEGPTDVMAFPMDGEELSAEHAEPSGPPRLDPNSMGALLGDVVLCPEVAAEQARQAGHSTESELQLLCTHGILHLLGYDHGESEEEREMFTRQAQLLEEWTKQSGRGPIRVPLAGTRGELRDTAGGARSGERRG